MIYICLEPEAQGHVMTFKVRNVGSMPYFTSYRGELLTFTQHNCIFLDLVKWSTMIIEVVKAYVGNIYNTFFWMIKSTLYTVEELLTPLIFCT